MTPLAGDLDELVPDHSHEQGLVGEQALVVGDLLLEIGVLGLDLVALQTLQSLQLHVQDGLGLDLGQTELLHQLFSGVIVAFADRLDDLVDVVQRDAVTLQNMGSRFGLGQVELRPSGEDFLLMLDVFG